MSLLDDVIQKAAEAVDAQAPLWVDDFVTKAMALLPGLPLALQAPAKAALAIVQAHALTLAPTTPGEFVGIVSHLALGDETSAKLVWLGEYASFEEREAAMDEAHAAVVTEAEAKAAEWAAVKADALAILKALGSAAVPLLLAAL